MLTPNLSKPEQSHIFLSILKAFDAPVDRRPSTSEEACRAALAECIAFNADWNFGLHEAFNLAVRVLLYRDSVCEEGEPAIYDVKALARGVGDYTLALTACKLVGAYVDDDGAWRDDGADEFKHPVLLSFSDDWGEQN